MANTYKNIVITPNIGNTSDPKIAFSGANASVNTDINLFVYPDSNGTISFEGSAGQLFSITNDLSNNLFGVNDVSGIPYLEVYANGFVSVAPFGGNVTIGNTAEFILSPGTGVYANGSLGTAGHVLHSNGSSVYWAADDNSGGTVTSVGTGNGLTGGAITTTGTVSVLANSGITANSTGLFVTQGTGTVVNATGVHVNATYIGTISANNASYLGGTAAASYQLNSTLNANIAAYLPTYTGVANGSSFTVGTSTISNSTGVYTGIVNAATHSVGTAFTANATVVNAVSYYAGTTLIGNTTGPYGKTEATLNVNSALTANNSTNLGGQAAAYYTNATNISTGTLALARGGTASSLTAVSGGVVYSNATGMAITAAGTNTYVLASNGTVPAWTQIDMSYLPESTFKKSVTAATTADLSAASATAQVLTGGLVVLPTQDGVPMVLNARLLVKDQSNTAQNGIYYVSNTGSAGVYAWTLTRTNDANTSSKIASALVAVDTGTVNGGRLFDNDFTTSGTIGTTAMTWQPNIDAGGGTFNGAINTTIGANAIAFSNATSNWMYWTGAGVAAPTVTTRSAGTKLVLYPGLSASAVDWAIGIESATMWFSASASTSGFKWYANTTNFMSATSTQLNHTGNVNAASLTVGTSTIANATGVYTGTVNASSMTANGFTAYPNLTTPSAAGFTVTSNGYFGVYASTNTSAALYGRATGAGGYGAYLSSTNSTPTSYGALIEHTTSGTALYSLSASGLSSLIVSTTGNPLYVSNNNNYTSVAPFLGVYANGNVGIGNSAPTEKLVVTGNVSTSGVLRHTATPFIEMATNVASNYTITTNYNAMSAGPITINTGVTVTIPTGSTWTVV